MNLYAYVGNDPVNYTDPLGLMRQERVCERGSTDGRLENGAWVASLRCYYIWVPDASDWSFWWGGGLREPRMPRGRDPLRDGPLYHAAGSPAQTTRTTAQDWCGSKGSEGVPDGNWGDACRAHDECYSTPGSSKVGCDLTLGANIIAVCGSKLRVLPSPCIVPGVAYSLGLLISGVFPKWRPSYRDAQGQSRPERFRRR